MNNNLKVIYNRGKLQQQIRVKGLCRMIVEIKCDSIISEINRNLNDCLSWKIKKDKTNVIKLRGMVIKIVRA